MALLSCLVIGIVEKEAQPVKQSMVARDSVAVVFTLGTVVPFRWTS